MSNAISELHIETVEGVVVALVAEFNLVDVVSQDGRSFVITRNTEGVKMTELQPGHRLSLQVRMRGSSKVIRATLL